MASRTTLGVDQHTIPLFYACYLLRSIKTKSSRSTYVGSTPDPPRRLRQHNGELTQGAYKTRRGRPWVMTMIVHGFPSKLAALQFEWAWQHPYISRHLRVSQTKQGKDTSSQIFKRDSKANILKTKILVARTMLLTPPYSTWPLHVKIFTAEAKQIWDEVHGAETIEELPEGLTVSVEFEGVDGKAVIPASRRPRARTGPIEVKDTEFILSHLNKYQSLANKGTELFCSVCSSEIDFKRVDHLRVALCPQSSCKAVSHLDCLAHSFLKHPSNPPGLIPRGGVCQTCDQYTLWGDVIRGCYRRARGGLQQPASEEELEESEDGNDDSVQLGDEISSHLENLQIGGSPRKVTKTSVIRVAEPRKNKPAPTPRAAKRGVKKGRPVDSDVEDFAAEMDAIDCDTEDSGPERPSRKSPGATARRRRALRPAVVENTHVEHNKPRDMDEIVRQALGDLSISAPSGPNQTNPAKSSRAKSTTVGRKPPKSARTKNRAEVTDKEEAGGGNGPRTKRTMLNTGSKSRKRTPSPEYIDLAGI